MKVLNVINNNVVSSLDEKNREIVVMGKGIGFHKKPGERIADTQVEKVFRLPDETHDRFMKLVQDISYTHMKLASDIIDYACEHVGRKLRKSIYVTLTDLPMMKPLLLPCISSMRKKIPTKKRM